MSWRALRLPLSLLALLALLGALLVLPDPKSITEARSAGVGVIFTASAGVIAFILQGWRSDRTQRLSLHRGAYKSMIGATQVMLDEQAELEAFPFGHPYPGMVGGPMTDAQLRHDPFAEAKALEAEWKRLYVEGERELLLETDRNDAVFVAWREVRKSFWDWFRRQQTITSEAWQRFEETRTRPTVDLDKDSELPELERKLRSNVDAFTVICRSRIKALS